MTRQLGGGTRKSRIKPPGASGELMLVLGEK